MSPVDERRRALERCAREALGCTRCPELVRTRTQVVFGTGNPDADLMFVGEAPGNDEDLQGVPFVGRSGRLLTELLGEVGIARADVYITNTLKCRPPDNRDPTPGELERCQDHLDRQLELVRPRVVCPLGNFATKLLRQDPAGITKVHGVAEVHLIGTRAVRIYPLFHPAAALYQRANVETLRADVARLPELLALPEPEQPPAAPEAREEEAGPPEPAAPEPDGVTADAGEVVDEHQLGLF